VNNADSNYVYFHRIPNGDVFYVGMGYADRAWEKDSRNKYWHNTVNKHGGYTVEIVHENLSIERAFELEKEYIAKFGRKKYDPNGTLVNLAEGGQGNRGFRKENLMHPVTAFDLKGNVVGRWKCIEDVATEGYSKQMVRVCVLGRKKSHKNLIWIPTAHESCKALIACYIASANNMKRVSAETRKRMSDGQKLAIQKGTANILKLIGKRHGIHTGIHAG